MELLLSILLFIVGIICLFIANNKNIEKNQECILITQKLKFLNQTSQKYNKQIKQLEQKKNKIQQDIEFLNNQYHSKKDSLTKELYDYENDLRTKMITIKMNYNQSVSVFKKEQEAIQKQILEKKKILNAAAEAMNREREKTENVYFYQIQIPEKNKKDIELLQTWKNQLNQPSIVSKIIWSTYIQRPTTDLCNRILKSKTCSGIYKITNLVTKQYYIGQSVDIATRWKNHIKCGLGIDAPINNKLYNSMQQYGITNFTFEVLEECLKSELNEKERLWIDMYQSDKLGLNSRAGNKK